MEVAVLKRLKYIKFCEIVTLIFYFKEKRKNNYKTLFFLYKGK